jgi:hypothetical protein
VLEAKEVPALMPGAEDGNGVPAAGSRGVAGRARVIANRAFAETVVVEPNGHGNGHENGRAPGDAPAQLATGDGPARSALGDGLARSASGDGPARRTPSDGPLHDPEALCPVMPEFCIRIFRVSTMIVGRNCQIRPQSTHDHGPCPNCLTSGLRHNGI